MTVTPLNIFLRRTLTWGVKAAKIELAHQSRSGRNTSRQIFFIRDRRQISHAFDRLRIEHERAGRYRAAGQTDTGFGVADRSEIADVSGKNAHRATLALADATAGREFDPVAFAEIQQRAVGGAPCKGRAGPVEPNLVALIG
jgi:hypothetical protein